ncbi:hypothetical protein SAMN05444920_10650 [Nonomuraea solani]|uniref:Uncharacterized protein n=1 Tax=Nonomuraea solani TaxID=1144553 RepID=A0A1H6DQ83_9ACTN|nr:DUF6461 domain-containing protein [Nonomuraea solani]SEG87264.1 hypothetical protein SAMN05444920_10650 [Nonomuraea solani]
MTTDSLTSFRWSLEHDPLGEIYCVTFVRGLDQAEVLRRYAPDGPAGREMSFRELDAEVGDYVMVTEGGRGGGHVGVIAVGGWCVAIEPWGWTTVMNERLARLSVGSEVVSVNRHDYASDDHFSYAVDGTVITCFGMASPDVRHGADKDRLNDLMREIGFPPEEIETDEEWEARYDDLAPNGLSRAFALATRLTGVTFTPDLLDGPLLVGTIADA